MVMRIVVPSEHDLSDFRNIFLDNKQYFRYDNARKYQGIIIGLSIDAIKNGYTNIVVKASTGIGKSDVAMCIAEKFRDSGYYVLSTNLGLTKQYKDDFEQLVEVKGRSNFPCPMKPGYTADRGPCRYRKQFSCNKFRECLYERQKNIGKNSDSVLSTPAYMCRVSRNTFPLRHISIWDECHNLEKFYMDLIDSYIMEKEYVELFQEPMPQYTTPEFWQETFAKIIVECDKRLEKQELLKDREVEKFKDLTDRANTGIRLLAKDTKRCKIFFDKTRHGNLIARFKPIKVNGLANSIMENISDIRLFFSATIPSINQFIFDLGLDTEKTFFINVIKNPFPIEHRPIHYNPCGFMTYKKKEQTLPLIAEDIVRVIDKHENERGVILPISHANRKYIYKKLCELGYDNRVLTHSSDKHERESVIDTFLSEVHEPLILISTYITEGFSFDDVLARWLYYMKVPFPDLSDPIVEARLLLEQDEFRENTGCKYIEPENGVFCMNYSCAQPCKLWYFCQTATRLEQGFGRIVRSPDDFGTLYIGDMSFPRFVKKSGFLLSTEFKRSILWKN